MSSPNLLPLISFASSSRSSSDFLSSHPSVFWGVTHGIEAVSSSLTLVCVVCNDGSYTPVELQSVDLGHQVTAAELGEVVLNSGKKAVKYEWEAFICG